MRRRLPATVPAGGHDIAPAVQVEVPEAAATHLVGALHRAEFRSRRVMPRLAPDWNFKAHRGPRPG